MRDSVHDWLRLALTPGVSVLQQAKLVEHFADAKQVFTASFTQVEAIVGAPCARALAAGPARNPMDAALEWVGQPNHHLVTLGDETYPQWLREIAQCPCVLYVDGRVELLDRPSFAIVGSRNATIQGARDAEAFALALSEAGLTIVSGLALGVDTAAHRGGLRGRASSVAVLGTGADTLYPQRNRGLADELARNGALVSEFALGTQPAPGNFPRRNRLISGLSRGVLVVEAAPDSGSLITARFALEQGREVFAIPGSIHSPLSKGCHQLIRDGAKLVESANDILEELRWPAAAAVPMPHIDADSDPLLVAMGHDPVSIDQIAQRTGRPASAIAARLAMLELEGVVALLAGGFFQRLARV